MKNGDGPVAGPACIYIVSCGHSGSTLLEVLLGRHRQVAAAGEAANFSLQCLRDESTKWPGKCSCGARPADCPVWSHVLARIEAEYGVNMRERPLDFRVSDIGLEEEYRGRAFRRMPFTRARRAFWRALRYEQYTGGALASTLCGVYRPQRRWAENRAFVLRGLAEVSNVSTVIDSSKDPLDMRDLYAYSGLPMKVLFLTRDCRGNVWSALRRGVYRGRAREQAINLAAREWVTFNARIRRLLEGMRREDWMHVRYEDLCKDPQGTLRSAFEFAGLDDDPSVLDEREHIAHTIAGNRIRFTNRQATISEDSAWRDNLQPADLDLIARIAAPLAQTFGYVGLEPNG